jgi:hypothetical protein
MNWAYTGSISTLLMKYSGHRQNGTSVIFKMLKFRFSLLLYQDIQCIHLCVDRAFQASLMFHIFINSAMVKQTKKLDSVKFTKEFCKFYIFFFLFISKVKFKNNRTGTKNILEYAWIYKLHRDGKSVERWHLSSLWRMSWSKVLATKNSSDPIKHSKVQHNSPFTWSRQS